MSDDLVPAEGPVADARIAYGAHASQFGDLYLPRDGGLHPVVVAIHGGFWRDRYDLTHLGFLCAALAGEGFAVWSLEYRRLGEAGGGWPGTFEDVATGAAHVTALADRHRLDLTRIVTLGHSAGGQLALWLGALHRQPLASPFFKLPRVPIRGVVALAAVSDLREGDRRALSDGVVSEFLGGSPADVPARYALTSPAELLPLGTPHILVHGDEDDTVPFALSERHADQATLLGDRTSLIRLRGAGHFEPILPDSVAWPQVLAAVRKLSGR